MPGLDKIQLDTSQFDFLQQYVERLLNENGFENLSEQTRSDYMPKLMMEAQKRIGIALLPKLTEESAKELSEIMQKEEVQPDEVKEFWQKNVPDLDQVVRIVLNDFASEFSSLLPKAGK